MKNFSILLAGIVIAAMLVFPASAGGEIEQINPHTNTDCYGVGCAHGNSPVNVQPQTGVINGDNNKQTQINYNDQSYNNQENDGKINGDGNTMVNTNINGDITNGATSVTNNQQVTFVMESEPGHYTLDTGVFSKQIVSMYMGEVYVAQNDIELIGDIELQNAGDKYAYTVKSSVPVLTYLINANDVEKVKSKDGAAEYDFARQIYDHNSVFIIFPKVNSPQAYHHQSTYTQFVSTLPETGRYALVIDTRNTNQLQGLLSEIRPSTVDIQYEIQKVEDGKAVPYERKQYGQTVIYKPTENGRVDTGSEVVINDFTE